MNAEQQIQKNINEFFKECDRYAKKNRQANHRPGKATGRGSQKILHHAKLVREVNRENN